MTPVMPQVDPIDPKDRFQTTVGAWWTIVSETLATGSGSRENLPGPLSRRRNNGYLVPNNPEA